MKPVKVTQGLHVQALELQGDTLGIPEVTKGVAAEPANCPPDSGARALMRAILHDAILCLQGNATGTGRDDRAAIAERARRWIVSRDTRWIFSFESICHVLDIDPDFVRLRVLRTRLVGPSAPARYDRHGRRGVIGVLRPARLRGKQTSGMHG